MNTIPLSASETEALADINALSWLAEREHDLASWLDEIDPELHEQVLCGPTVITLSEIFPTDLEEEICAPKEEL